MSAPIRIAIATAAADFPQAVGPARNQERFKMSWEICMKDRRPLILSVAFSAVSPPSRTHFCKLYKPAEKSPKSA
jgi:hypothetical protein